MANHVESVKQASFPLVGKDEAWKRVRSGMLGFCSGSEPISKAIEGATHSPWSHVFLIWGPVFQRVWLTIEATLEKGVHVGLLSDYIAGGDGDLAFASRIDPTSDLPVEMNSTFDAELALLDESYATAGLIQEGAHKLLKIIPPDWNKNQCYCSGLQWRGSQASTTPFPARDGAPTPEDLWCDPNTKAIFGLLKGKS